MEAQQKLGILMWTVNKFFTCIKKMSSMYFPLNPSLNIGNTQLTWSTYELCFRWCAEFCNNLSTIIDNSSRHTSYVSGGVLRFVATYPLYRHLNSFLFSGILYISIFSFVALEFPFTSIVIYFFFIFCLRKQIVIVTINFKLVGIAFDGLAFM